ncbi:hypothetical protein QIL24_gp1 [ssRNA phage SRR6960509_6]|uniref:Uncharacterized protein n=1 Tax=ssRNA phage SRR6960509_6 TaxID=2786533 RepID=A0A8S5L016_9VIRU|nr:hypothetical protein QIL24_gp1 [ssRNA phage SRR6960509_6]DAD50969.1 TPA_asm: hypothetical protein [ssRNA phage SRR6960509_6]
MLKSVILIVLMLLLHLNVWLELFEPELLNNLPALCSAGIHNLVYTMLPQLVRGCL